jgi:retron-type reverse transcriptase
MAWKEFLVGKKSRADVQEFQRYLMSNIFLLHSELKTKTYKHSTYEAFKISDPKPRDIHKAKVRDRLLHHAIYRTLYPFFDKKFISDSYSCRIAKGQHKANEKFRKYCLKVSKNNTKQVWILKCDIKKFFASIDQPTLFEILKKYIKDIDLLLLLRNIIKSFSSTGSGKGLPLGNLTSQLLVNIYMNEFDQYVKHKLKAKYYIRYADDFVILSNKKYELESLTVLISDFLQTKLKLSLHPNKVFIKTLASGVDFLGWVHFSYNLVPRTSTKRRMFKKLENNQKESVLNSYLGMLGHGNAYKLQEKIKDGFLPSQE